MNTLPPIGTLLSEIQRDLTQPDVMWQVAVLGICLGVAWLVSYLVNSRPPLEEGRAWKLGHSGLKRLAFPLTALLLVLVARWLGRHWLHVNLLSLAVPLLLSLAVIRGVFFILRYSFKGAWLGSFERAFALIVWSLVALHLTDLLPELIQALESVRFTVGKQHLDLWLVLQGVGTVLAMLLVALWVGGLIESRLMAAPGLNSNLRVVFTRLSRAALILLAVLISLPLVGIDLTTLSVFSGALGVGLGFGLQKIAANYVSGFIILLDRSIRIGDMIAVGQERGQVTRITTRYTVLKGMAGVESIVPNEILVSSIVQNESYTDTKIRVVQSVQVGYSSNLEQALSILATATRGQPRVLADPGPKAFVVEFADSGIGLELAYWIEDPEAGTQQIRSDINLEIYRRFKEAGIEIPFPQREIRVLGHSGLDLAAH